MNESDAYRIALSHAGYTTAAEDAAFARGWLSALVWQQGELNEAVTTASYPEHYQLMPTAQCDHCGWSTTTQQSPETLLQLHERHSHPDDKWTSTTSGCTSCGLRTNPREYDGLCPDCYRIKFAIVDDYSNPYKCSECGCTITSGEGHQLPCSYAAHTSVDTVETPTPHQHFYVDGQCVGCGFDET